VPSFRSFEQDRREVAFGYRRASRGSPISGPSSATFTAPRRALRRNLPAYAAQVRLSSDVRLRCTRSCDGRSARPVRSEPPAHRRRDNLRLEVSREARGSAGDELHSVPDPSRASSRSRGRYGVAGCEESRANPRSRLPGDTGSGSCRPSSQEIFNRRLTSRWETQRDFGTVLRRVSTRDSSPSSSRSSRASRTRSRTFCDRETPSRFARISTRS